MVIGDGLGNIVAQTPLVRAVADLFQETHVWMPRSRPDLPQLLAGLPGVAKVATEWNPEFERAAAVFDTWLVSSEVDRQTPIRSKPRYSAPSPRGQGRNEVEVCMDAAWQAGWRGPTPRPYLRTRPIQLPASMTSPEKIVGISTGRLPSSQWRLKEYPAEQYVKVVDLVAHENPHVQFVHFGWPSDTPLCHPRVWDARGRWSLPETLHMIGHCSAFLSNDSGLAWAASALEIPCAVVFGPTDPVKCLPPWGAVAVRTELYCQPCQWRTIGQLPNRQICKHECMTHLPPEAVAEAVNGLLRDSPERKSRLPDG